MALHFTREEFAERQQRAMAKMESLGLSALLIFRQESAYYLTGFDSFGFVFFQCLVLCSDGRLFLLTRAPDYRQAQLTSVINEIHIWRDGAGVDPTRDLKALLQSKGLAGKKLGVEYDSYGLTGHNCKRLENQLAGFANLVDASHLVSYLRMQKSPSEIAYHRRAAQLADSALTTALPLIKAGGDEGEILAKMQGAVLAGGGDYSGNPFIIGANRHALLCRTKSGRDILQQNDQLTLEWAGVYRMYHAAMMRTMVVGKINPIQAKYFDIACETLQACEASLKVGNIMGEVYQAHCDILDKNGLSGHRLNACGYAMGALFQPNWMDFLMFYQNNPYILQENECFFLHIIIMDSDNNIAMCVGRSSLVGVRGANVLSHLPLSMTA